jgi:ABC-type Fe3+/spermidine/putrescine transport system ATPase subunit
MGQGEGRQLMTAPGGSSTLPSVELRGVAKTFGDGFQAVRGLDLSIRSGEFVTLLGPSGSGKTTTLRMIAGFESPTSGEILVLGQDVARVPAHLRPVNTVFQDYALFPHLSVFDNVAYGLKAKKLDRTSIAEKAGAMLERVGLAGFGHRAPSSLSGGQRQRVALARALVCEPRVLLLDEPLGALDLKLRKQLQLQLIELCQALGITFVHVTHDQDEALTMSDRIAVMHDGRLEQFAPPHELYHRPASTFVAGFVGENNILRGRLAGGTVEVADASFQPPQGIGLRGPAVDVAIRPEFIRTGPARESDAVVSVTVEQVIFAGSETRLVTRLVNGTPLVAHLPAGAAAEHRRGERISLAWSVADARCFEAAVGPPTGPAALAEESEG